MVQRHDASRSAVRSAGRPVALAAGLLVALVTLVAAPLPVAAAPGDTPADDIDDINDKRAEAAAIEQEIEALGRRAALVLDEYHQAVDALEAADADLLELRARVEGLRRDLEATQDVADTRIRDLYRGGSSSTAALHYLDAATVQEIGTLHHYTSTLASQDRARITELSVRRAQLAEEEDRLRTARDEVARQERALREQRAEVEEAMADRQAAFDRAQGELAELVEQERQRRAEEEARRARAELERRRAEEARRRAEEEARRAAQATTTTQPEGGDATGPTPSPSPEPEPSPPSPSSSPAPPVHPNAGTAVAEAQAQIGKPYQWAGNGPESFDCSGLTKWAWAAAGVSIPRSSQTQYAGLPHVAFDEIQPGDLLFYGAPIHHVGIYIGNGEMVNAPYTGTTVRVDSIYRNDFAGAARPA